MKSSLIFLVFLCHLLCLCSAENRYSKDANTPVTKPGANDEFYKESDKVKDIRNLESPFRMAKLNILWAKAKKRLTESKLNSLYSDLKHQDKEEILWKKLQSEGKDKEGLQIAALRKKLKGIMNDYGLTAHFDDVDQQEKPEKPRSDKHVNKSLFKDKKLNKLWEKAELSGFSEIELKTLKEEFQHHQDKIDQYYSLLENKKNDEDNENHVNRFNELDGLERPVKDMQDGSNMIRKQHQEIKEGYDRLHRLSVSGPESKEFVEPKVQGLWKLALNSDFTPDELDSLLLELKDYEQRLIKLRHLQVEMQLVDERSGKSDKTEGRKQIDDKIKKRSFKVEKMHEHLETRILQRHSEL